MSPRTFDSMPRDGARLAPPPSTLASRVARQATTDGTRQFLERSAGGAEFRRELPRGLSVSALGIGTYLGDCTDTDDAAYVDAIRAAIAAGVNVIDTAVNYRCQRSERAVGRAMAECLAERVATRDALVVCTKGGYVEFDGAPPVSRQEYDAWLERELFANGVVTREELVRGGHCIAPKFLSRQLARSRQNLGVEAIDLYYLHNPEEQLLGVDRATFTRRLRAAFVLLEERAAAGEIGGYGCATWTGLRVPPDHRQHLPLASLVALAREVGGTLHHFRAVQLPVSLAMPEAARLPTQALGRHRVPLLEAAEALGVAVVASAPLMQGRLTDGLPAEVRDLLPGCTTDAQRALRFAASLPSVRTVLAGMRRREHVTENVSAWRH
ncbi:MAG TPA: aldo/keto reductase [Gemmatimonadaceae bacterium]